MGDKDRVSKMVLLPISRVKTIMRSSPEVTNLSPDSIFLIAKAAESFVAYLARQAWKATGSPRHVDYPDLAKVIDDTDCLAFLVDIIPRKIKAKEYFDILKRVEEQEAKTKLEESL